MAYEIVMPRLGWTMEEGTLVEWLKHDGEAVKEGEILFTVESDKALNEVEAMESGILRIPPDSPPPGSVASVGALLAYIVKAGEKAPFEAGAAPAHAGVRAQTAPTGIPASSTPTPSIGTRTADNAPNGSKVAISPRARRVAQELGVDWHTLQGSGRTGRIVERDIRAAAQLAVAGRAPAVRASPLARRMAQELDIDLDQIAEQKTAPGKRIVRADIEAAARDRVPQAPSDTRVNGERLVPISATRRITAERMAASAHAVAPVTLTTEVDATELVRLRKQLKSDSPTVNRPVPTYTDLLIKLCAEALADHPMLNARFQDDRIAISEAVHIGIAVDSDRGLLVPVLRDVQGKSLRMIAAESAGLIERARNGQVSADEMRGSTFTITNLGMFEIDAFTPIINLPECAILGVGRIAPKQVVIDTDAERLAIRHMMFLSLTFDHRLVDGAPAARFVQRVKQFIEHPYLWLV